MKSAKSVLAGLALALFAVVACAADGIKPDTPFTVPLLSDGAAQAVISGDQLKVDASKPFAYSLKLIEDTPTPPPPVQKAKYVVIVGSAVNRTVERADLLRDMSLRELVGNGNYFVYDIAWAKEWDYIRVWTDLATKDAAKVAKDPATTPWWFFAKDDWTVIASEPVPVGHDAVEARLLTYLPDRRAAPQGRLMGCLPRKEKCGESGIPVMGPEWLIPRAQWKPVTLEALIPEIKDQDGTNECCAHMGVELVELDRSVRGLPFVKLSPASIYRFGNGNVDGGMTLPDCIRILVDRGALPSSKYPDLDWRAQYPKDGAEVARDYRVTNWVDIPNTDYLGSAIQRGWPCGIGVWWSRGSGHAIVVVGWRPESPQWRIWNSWGADWSDAGKGGLGEGTVSQGINSFGAFGVQLSSRPEPTPPAPKTSARPRLAPQWTKKAQACPSGNCPVYQTAP